MVGCYSALGMAVHCTHEKETCLCGVDLKLSARFFRIIILSLFILSHVPQTGIQYMICEWIKVKLSFNSPWEEMLQAPN